MRVHLIFLILQIGRDRLAALLCLEEEKTACDLHHYSDIIRAKFARIPMILKGFQRESKGFVLKIR